MSNLDDFGLEQNPNTTRGLFFKIPSFGPTHIQTEINTVTFTVF